MTRSGNFAERRNLPEPIEKFGRVSHLALEVQRLLMRRVAFGEKLIVFFERRAAASGVGDDGVKILTQEDVEVYARLGASAISHSGVGCKRTAADLPFRHDYLAAVRGKHADGGRM